MDMAQIYLAVQYTISDMAQLVSIPNVICGELQCPYKSCVTVPVL